MAERLLMAAFCVWLAWPESTKPPLTSSQLQAKVKMQSISNMCKKQKTKTVKRICKRWAKQEVS